jgi:hypothetical protein
MIVAHLVSVSIYMWMYENTRCNSVTGVTEHSHVQSVKIQDVPYILESNPHPVFGDFLNEKKVSSRF